MSNRLAQIAMRAAVRSFAGGAAQDAVRLMAIANFLAPSVDVPSALFQYQVFNDQNQFRIPKTKRGIGGRATQVDVGGEPVNGQLVPYALDYPLDAFEQLADDDAVERLMKNRSRITAQLAALSWSYDVAALALATVGAGTGLAANTANMDFVDEIDQRIITCKKASRCGELCEVRVLFGPNALRLAKNHSSTLARFKGGGAGNGKVAPNTEEFVGLLMGGVKGAISWATYDAADQGAAVNNTFLFDNSVLIFASAEAPTEYDPSWMKTFRMLGEWMKVGAYTDPGTRSDVFTTDWYGLPKVTNTATGIAARLNLTAV